ncbi:MAG: hypothetical protein ACREID_04660, partial [Planctomycetota bacterium]
MRYSVEWLADHVDLTGIPPERIAELFLLHVAEVAELRFAGDGWPGVTAARVIELRPHPNADRLRIARLLTGNGEAEVVCGAPNIEAGQMVCFAPEGTRLPGGMRLERRTIRGVESAGMALSEKELAISDDNSGIVVLPPDVVVGVPVAGVLGGAVLEVENTSITSRPDLWGHYGAARELAAILERELRPLDLGDAPDRAARAGEPRVEVAVRDRKLCPRYLGWAIGGVRVG